MPRIKLKPKSAEYEDGPKPKVRICDMPDCNEQGAHKAPKNSELEEYYYFCYEHVSEYNKAWNFFSGMTPEEMQEHMFKSMYGDRPTWRYDGMGFSEEYLRRTAWHTYNYSYGSENRQEQSNGKDQGDQSDLSAEMKALEILGLSPPVDLEAIKQRYKSLAKKYHPDLNAGCKESEDLLKQINMSYTILKLAYEKYEKLVKPKA